jgi:hypothetical protein
MALMCSCAEPRPYVRGFYLKITGYCWNQHYGVSVCPENHGNIQTHWLVHVRCRNGGTDVGEFGVDGHECGQSINGDTSAGECQLTVQCVGCRAPRVYTCLIAPSSVGSVSNGGSMNE